MDKKEVLETCKRFGKTLEACEIDEYVLLCKHEDYVANITSASAGSFVEMLVRAIRDVSDNSVIKEDTIYKKIGEAIKKHQDEIWDDFEKVIKELKEYLEKNSEKESDGE